MEMAKSLYKKKVFLRKLILSVLLLFLYIFSAFLFRCYHYVQHLRCSSRLEGMGSYITVFENDNKRKPADFLELVSQGGWPRSYLKSPEESNIENTEHSYIYRGNDLKEDAHRDMILVYEKNANHCIGKGFISLLQFDHKTSKGRCVLYSNGSSVDFMTDVEFQEAIKKDNALRRESGLSEKPIE